MIELSPSYQRARTAFLTAAQAKGYAIENNLLEGYRGIDDELLYCDIARKGQSGNKKCMVISSGLHGVEGYCGSAVQHQLLEQALLENLPSNISVILIHAFNPYGFSFSKRVNENNIDMNRNFIDFSQSIALDTDIKEFNETVFPREWQGAHLSDVFESVYQYRNDRGVAQLQTVLTGGQYHYPQGIFYGGESPQWTRNLWDKVCHELASEFDSVVHIDIHTGLGENGDCELMYLGANQDTVKDYVIDWFGRDIVKIPGQAGSTSKPISGHLASHLDNFNIDNIAIALEFGTQDIDHVLVSLINDSWLQANPDCDDIERKRIIQTVRDAFMTQSDEWQTRVWEQSKQFVEQAIAGLSAIK